jgi:hypothetical protein
MLASAAGETWAASIRAEAIAVRIAARRVLVSSQRAGSRALDDIGHGVLPVMETPEWSIEEQQASTQQKPRPECWSGLLCLPLLRQFEPFEPIRAMGIP